MAAEETCRSENDPKKKEVPRIIRYCADFGSLTLRKNVKVD